MIADANDIIQTCTLPNGKVILLNDQQVEALSAMRAWVEYPTDLFFTLSGYAGTGKTTITKEFLRWYKTDKRYSWNGIAVSAPTHKAKKVIHRATGESASTIQKLLGLRPNTDLEDFDINNPQFDPKASKEIAFIKLLIIDEASMLNENLFDMIVAEATRFKTKVLFMGDEAQLPPVKEYKSKIFTSVESRYELTKVERQSDSNPIMRFYDLIRSDLKARTDMFPHDTRTNPNTGEGIIFHNSLPDFESVVLPLFASPEFREDSDHIKLITYTNDSVKAWNKKIRDHIHGSPTCPVIAGDIMFGYSTVNGELDECIIENSADYKVMSVSDDISSDRINVFRVELRSVDEKTTSFARIVKDQGLPTFVKKFKEKLAAAKLEPPGRMRSIKWRSYFAFKEAHLLLNDIYEDGRLLVKKDLDYGYAITVHKSQGSTYRNIAVSENNIDRNRNDEERNKLKYVAFSRPTHQAIIYTNKTDRIEKSVS